jgi:hypothetical protein
MPPFGRISGTPADVPPLVTPAGFVTTILVDAVVSGEADNRGRFNGMFDGAMGLWRFGFPCDKTATCSTTGFTWTLRPH